MNIGEAKFTVRQKRLHPERVAYRRCLPIVRLRPLGLWAFAMEGNIGEHFQRPSFMPALLMLPRQIQGSMCHGARFIYAAAQQISFAQPHRAERQESDSSGSSQIRDAVF